MPQRVLVQYQGRIVAADLVPAHTRPELRIFHGMWTRCTNPEHVSYARYGGRGVTICERWKSFANFFEDMGPRPSPKHSIDRIKTSGNYEPGNCRWATEAEQAHNRGNAVYVEYEGKQQRLYLLAKQHNLPLALVYARIFTAKWSVEKALSTPIGKRGRPRKTG